MRIQPSPARSAQRGAAALVVTLALFLAMVLVALFTNRNLVFEQRSAANQYRSTQAFEAAEAGLEWALAQLNANQRIDADCLPVTDLAATSFRARYLGVAPRTGALLPRTWAAASGPSPLLPGCVHNGSGWSCNCPSHGPANLVPPSGPAPAVAFSVQFLPVGKPGVVRIVANGCTRLAGACLAGASDQPEASARIEVMVGLVAGLRTPPAATVTARGTFATGSAALGLHNPDPATGLLVDAGGGVDAAAARLTPPAGASAIGRVVDNDAALAGLDADRLFASYFGVAKAEWKAQPAVTRIHCTIDCATVLASALAGAADAALVHVDGDLTLAGPIALGSPAHPVVVVVDGDARLADAVAIHGVLHARSITWDHTSGGAFLRGALIAEADYRGIGTPELFYDTTVLDTLTHASGSFARVAGSWRDF